MKVKIGPSRTGAQVHIQNEIRGSYLCGGLVPMRTSYVDGEDGLIEEQRVPLELLEYEAEAVGVGKIKSDTGRELCRRCMKTLRVVGRPVGMGDVAGVGTEGWDRILEKGSGSS